MSDAYDPSCIFCRIVAGEVPTELLHASDSLVAFRDLNPVAPTHILLVPKAHLRDLSELDDGHAGALTDLVQAATHLARTEGVHESGWRLVSNVGPDAGQAVFHLHFHLLGGRKLGALG
jgi:histidine triad (HIT) family protein